jgi:uncharacterized iron-regulated membrane protein
MRFLRLLHAWAGTFLSLLLALLGLSGALLVFKNDYVQASVPEARLTMPTDPMSLAQALETVERIHGPQSLNYVTFGGDQLGLHHLVFTNEVSSFLNAQGAKVSVWEKNGRFEDWLFDLHGHLLSGDTGELLAGSAALAAVIMCLTGIAVWWPCPAQV